MKVLLVVLLLPALAVAQPVLPDRVAGYSFGNNTDFGQDAQYFPANVLRFPDTSATLLVPSANPDQVVSLGLGGWITLSFENHPVTNGPGPDFVVFENVFWPGGDSTRAWKEPGLVSVSESGSEWVTFPYDSVTWAGCAGLTPTRGNRLAMGWPACGGDAFDLEAVGLTSVKFIRIEDRSSWNLMGSGFDLDGVLAFHTAQVSVADKVTAPEKFRISVVPNPANPASVATWNQPAPGPVSIRLITLTGQIIREETGFAQTSGMQSRRLDLSGLSSGIYFLSVSGSGFSGSARVVLIR